MATNAPVDDGHRNGMVRKRFQQNTAVEREAHWTKRSRKPRQFLDEKKDDTKFKGVRREAPKKEKL